MKHKEVTPMTNKETKALLKAIEIIVRLAPTRKDILRYIKEISNELKKEPTTPRKK